MVLFIVLGECKLSCLDSIVVGRKPMVALSLAELPGNDGHLALAMGGLDNKIHIYSGERTGKVCIIWCICLFCILPYYAFWFAKTNAFSFSSLFMPVS